MGGGVGGGSQPRGQSIPGLISRAPTRGWAQMGPLTPGPWCGGGGRVVLEVVSTEPVASVPPAVSRAPWARPEAPLPTLGLLTAPGPGAAFLQTPPPTPAFLIYVPPREGGVFFKNRTMWENNKAQNRTVTGGAAGRLVSAEGSRFSLAVLRNTNTRWLPRAHGGSHARAAHGAGLPGPRPHPSPGGNPQSRRQLQLCLPVPWA